MAIAEIVLDELQRGPGCSDACRIIMVIRPGLFGRQPLLLHDPEAHETYGRILGFDGEGVRVLETGVLTFDRAALTVAVDGAEVRLSATELRILQFLAESFNRFRLYRDIVGCVWGADWLLDFERGPDKNNRHSFITTPVARLRARLGPRAAGLIETRLNVGLRLRDWPIGEDAPPVLPGPPRKTR